VLYDSIAFDAMNNHGLAIVDLSKGTEAFVVRRCYHVHLITGPNQSSCQALGETRGAIYIRWEGIASDHNALWRSDNRCFGHF
jgi:hypothetical protein